MALTPLVDPKHKPVGRSAVTNRGGTGVAGTLFVLPPANELCCAEPYKTGRKQGETDRLRDWNRGKGL